MVRAFDHARKRGRLAHAYLFCGPPGVGKRLFANELAKALLCENPPGPQLEACDRCSACHQVEAGTHPDFFATGRPEEVLEFPIDLVRELCHHFSLKAARGHGKVAILDDADDLNEASANCCLKTLEEPPPRSVLVLIGTSPDRQLPTIVSRCQVVRFAPLSQPVIADLLREQGVEDPALIERLAQLGGGSVREALALADPAFWEFRRKVLDGLTQPQPDTVALAREWVRFVEDAGKEAPAQRRRAGLALRLVINSLGDALRLSVGGTPLLAERGELPLLHDLVKRTGPEKLLELLERCLEGDKHIDRRVQLVLALEGLLDALGQKLKPGPSQGEGG
jgi:DNA polymerase-3 subunit delta'